MLGQQIFDYDLCSLDAGRVILAFDRKPDLTILEAVQHVTGGNRTQPRIGNFTDGRLLFDIDVDAPTFGGLLTLEADVLEVSCVPERIEVALQTGGVVDVARFGVNPSLDRLRGNAAVAVDYDFGDHVLLGPTPWAKKDQYPNQEVGDNTPQA